jgi:hypothetical protein
MKVVGKIILLAVVIIIAVIIGFGFFSSSDKKEANPVFGKLPQMDVTGEANLKGIKILTDFKSKEEIPPLAQVYKVEKRFFGQVEYTKVAKRLGFTQKPQKLKTNGKTVALLWKTKTKSLTVSTKNGFIEYTNKNVKLAAGKDFPKSAKIAKKVSQFLKKTGLPSSDLKVDVENPIYYVGSGAEFRPTTEEKKAKYVEIGYNRKLSGYPTLFDESSRPPASFLVSRSGVVSKFFYQYAQLASPQALYPLRDVGSITPRQIQELGFLVYPDSRGFFDPELIKQITVEDYALVYLDDQKSGYILPVYVLRGVGKTGTETLDVVIYFPAISSEWSK